MAINRYLILISASVSSVYGGFVVYKKNNRPPSPSQSSLSLTSTASASTFPTSPDEQYLDLPDIIRHLETKKSKSAGAGGSVVDYENETKEEESSTHTTLDNIFSKIELVLKLKNELDCLKTAQTNSYYQSVKLARSPNANVDLNQFRAPIKVDKLLLNIDGKSISFDLNELLIHLLKCLTENGNQSECANYLTRQALVLFEPYSPLNDMFFYHEYDDRNNDFPKLFQRYSGLFFQTIIQNIISNEESALTLVNNGLLIAFHKILQIFPDINTSRWICNCISTLSFYRDSHLHFYHTGWIGILAKWIRSDDWQLKLEAAKTLYNMSQNKESLNQSVYLLWPIYEIDSSEPEYDIIFIHGLKGGVLRTWRQSDKMKNSPDYTECWPESWLSKDFSNSRILAVHYESFLSSWNVTCPSDEFTIKDRSIKLIDELQTAGVGRRPIIWITHSMGGLLLKQMLAHIHCDISSKHSFLNQTKGIVFYSVPHHGSEMAVWSQNIQKLIAPSIHVLELRKDCPKLIELHQKFTEIIKERQIECLSFGETKKCTLLKNPIEWKAILVPEESANPGIGKFIILPEDHFNICKPKDKNSESYRELRKFLERIVLELKLTKTRMNFF